MIMCTPAKFYNARLNIRPGSFAEASNMHSHDQQRARPSRCTSNNIFILQQVRKECFRKGEKFICSFLDLSEAFDRVNWTKLYQLLEMFYLPLQFVRAVENFTEAEQWSSLWDMPPKILHMLMVSFEVIRFLRDHTSCSRMFYLFFWIELTPDKAGVIVNILGFMADFGLLSTSNLAYRICWNCCQGI